MRPKAAALLARLGRSGNGFRAGLRREGLSTSLPSHEGAPRCYRGPANVLAALAFPHRPWPAVRVELVAELGGVVSAQGLGSVPAPPGPDKLHGLLVVGGAFVLSLGISLWAKRISEPERGEPPAPPTTAGIAGYPS